MIQAIIFGAEHYAKSLYQKILLYNNIITQNGGEKLNVSAFLARNEEEKANTESQIPVITTNQVPDWINAGKLEVILVPAELYGGPNSILSYFLLWEIGLDNIYFSKKEKDCTDSNEDILDLFTPFYSYSFLPYLEFHLADHCNLNCAACEHYSGLVEKPTFPTYEKFERDFKQLKKWIHEIHTIRLLGGEPLLNQEIEKYILLCRKLYPDSNIWIVTNGLLLKNMADSFFQVLNECHAYINISYYPPLEKSIDSLIDFLNEKKVQYFLSEKISQFRKCQTLTPNDDITTYKRYITCFQKGCRNLYDGKLAACFLPFTTKYFNKYFNKNIPEDGIIDLYAEDLTLEKIMQQLTTPFERCRYCDSPVDVDWKTIENPSHLDDWVKDGILK